jgi:hypothetical protein
MELPRNLYKSPGSIIVNATKSYDTILVSTMEEYNDGLDAGYIDSYAGALNQKNVSAPIEPDNSEGPFDDTDTSTEELNDEEIDPKPTKKTGKNIFNKLSNKKETGKIEDF